MRRLSLSSLSRVLRGTVTSRCDLVLVSSVMFCEQRHIKCQLISNCHAGNVAANILSTDKDHNKRV